MKRLILLISLGLILLLSTSSSPQTPVRCGACGGTGAILVGYNYYGPVYQPCGNCGGTGVVYTRGYNPSFRGDNLVKTDAKCKKKGCHCDGYIGVKSSTGLYYGPCQNTDGWGHKCGHSPKDHGLKGS